MRIRLREQIAAYNANRRDPASPLLNQKRLAAAVGVKAAAVSDHVAGKREPKLDLLRRYAAVLECDISALIPLPEDTDTQTLPQSAQNCKPVKQETRAGS